ncbi:MAG: hypothetical protein IPH76_13970 [Xanthomonadales bacterium]|nr:hypothetical protein [Xanthomonadales bacterium]
MILKAHTTQPTTASEFATGVTLASTMVVANPVAASVSIATSGPTTGLTAPATVTFNASAIAGHGATISKVEYFNGLSTTPFATSTVGPAYSYSWTNLAAGTYSVRARATQVLPDGRSFVSPLSGALAFVINATGQAGVCFAANAPTFHACLAQLHAGLTQKIQVQGMIDCSFNTSAKGSVNPCNFVLDSLSAPAGTRLAIVGDLTIPSGFIRNGSVYEAYRLPVLNINNVDGLEVRGLSFNEGPQVIAGVGNGTITVIDSSDIAIIGNRFNDSKFTAIALRRNARVQIKDNEFNDVQIFGIWGANEASEVSSGVEITNNSFQRTFNNAILASFVDSQITYNQFVGNHYVPLFGYSGGQFAVEKNSSNVLIGCNIVSNGSIAGYHNANGIEIAQYDMSNIRIIGNVVQGHDGYGITVNYDTVNMSNILIRGNSLSNNGISPFTQNHPGSLGGQIDFDFPNFVPTLENNCNDLSCVESCDSYLAY